MRKVFATDDHAELIRAAGGTLFHFFERGERMTKSASEAFLKKDIQDYMPPDTHFGVHLIFDGAEEDYGPNRNGDSASRKSLNAHHKTFEKYGCVYREHKNRCPRTQGIGQVKVARMNNKSHRGELLVWVEKDKAPDMYKAAKDGKELSWSMSMRLPQDECSCCRKKSRTREEYCPHLKNQMLSYVSEFQKYAYARNEEGVKYFDISEVKKRAARIATYLSYFGDSLQKAASADELVISGSEWADHVMGVDSAIPFSPWEDRTLEKMAAEVRYFRDVHPSLREVVVKTAPRTLTHDAIQIMAGADFRSLSGELAKRGMLLDFPTFASLVTGESVTELQTKKAFCDVGAFKLPFLLDDIVGRGGCACGEDAAGAVTPDEDGCSFSPHKDAIDKMLNQVGENLDMRPERAQERAVQVIIIKQASIATPPPASFDPFYEAMAEAYGHYLVKASHIIAQRPGLGSGLFLASAAAALLKNFDK
jgi:hypothetical protein